MDASISSSEEDDFLPSATQCRRARSARRRSNTPRLRKKAKTSFDSQQLQQKAVGDSTAAAETADPPTSQQLEEDQTAAQQPASCPICSVLLSTVSETEAGRAAHVNGCLDAAGTPTAVGQPACSAIDMTGPEEEKDAEKQPAQEADADMERW